MLGTETIPALPSFQTGVTCSEGLKVAGWESAPQPCPSWDPRGGGGLAGVGSTGLSGQVAVRRSQPSPEWL